MFTQGGTVSAGEKLLDIVPDDAPLIIRAEFQPTDINGVEPGAAAEIRFASLHERDLPIMLGVVQSVSADVSRDEHSGQSFYAVDISVPSVELAKIQRARRAPRNPTGCTDFRVRKVAQTDGTRLHS